MRTPLMSLIPALVVTQKFFGFFQVRFAEIISLLEIADSDSASNYFGAQVFSPDITKTQFRDTVDHMSENDFARFLYCQQIAETYLAVSKFEEMLIMAMWMCDRVRLKKKLGPDMARWQQALDKQTQLQASTVGSLIRILELHDVSQPDIAYLRWIKDKRDYFIHRLFHDGAWPGDLDILSCRAMARRLIAVQLWLARAEHNIWSIFERAGLVELNHLPEGGILATNMGIYDPLEPK